MAFKLTSMSALFLLPDKPETFAGPQFFTNTVFLETGETFGTAPDNWLKVQLPNTQIDGWMKMSAGIIVPDPARPVLDEEGFVRSALMAEDAFNTAADTAPNFVFADYVLALAFVESGMTNLGAVPPSDAVGPLQITDAKWQDFKTNGKPFSDIFSNRDRPSAQAYCASYRMRADGRAIAKAAGGAAPKITLLDLFHAYLTNSPAAALPIRDAAAIPANANKGPEEVNAALTKDLVITVFGKLQKLVLGSTFPANFDQFVKLTEAALNAALQKAAALIQTHAPDQVPPAPPANADDPLGPRPGQGASPASGLNYTAAGVPAARHQFGDMIVARFSAAGYGKNQQIAAVANAIGESNLNPNAKSAPPERSFGLFQCNQGGGLGNGFSEAQLCDPETNIAIIIKEAKRFKEFANAASLDAAVEVFVRKVERPAHPDADIAKRVAIAHRL